MDVRFKEKSKIVDIAIVLLAGIASVGMMIYAVFHFGLKNAWNELILNMFYLACLVMIAMYFFKVCITTKQFNYWCSLCVGITVLLRDILFPPPLVNYPLHLSCMTLSVILVLMLIFFYSRKDWVTYSKRNLWMICIVDMVLALLYNIDIILEPTDEYTAFMLTEIWIRPTITYGLVACFIKDDDNLEQQVQSTELIRTSQSWDGVELPDYLQGRPEIVAIKYEIPVGQKLSWHHHPVMNHGILVQGDLTIISENGKEKVVHEGEAVVEMVGTIHHGENRGSKPIVLYMFYLSQEGLPLSVQHPEITLA
jgi:quercetin dioxygenase-like cupin family protein